VIRTAGFFLSCALLTGAQPCPESSLLTDWAGLIRYGSENTEIRPPAPGERRVVFLGDELTEDWPTRFFAGKPWFNRGIRGQTSAQMLVRFRQDVISLKPKAVVIHAGANDLAGVTGPATQAVIAENIMSMVELARVNDIRVVLASLTPVCDCGTPQTRLTPPGKIFGVNGWLEEYAVQTGSVYLDYQTALGGRTLRQDLTRDGFRLHEGAYEIMAPLAERAVAAALGEH
jgi:lysophospholipase L1-like esterase